MLGGAADETVNSAPANTRDNIAGMSQAPYGPGTAGPAPWPPQGSASSAGGPSRLPTIIAIVIALIAVAVAIAAWFRPAPKAETPAAKTYSEQEITDAKKAVCDAYNKVDRALTAASSKGGGGQTNEDVLIGINVRLALTESAQYLLTRLAENPAAPAGLAKAIRDASDAYQAIAIARLGEAPQSEVDEIIRNGDPSISEVKKECQ